MKKAIIEKIDNALDLFCSPKLNDIENLLGPRLRNKVRNDNFETISRYIVATMSCVRHPNAEGFVYAHHFHDPNQKMYVGAYAENVDAYDKIGYSKDFKTRLPGIKKIKPNLKFQYTLAIFPFAKLSLAKAIEEEILDSLMEDHVSGEWFYSSIGVLKVLLRWHVAFFGPIELR